MKRYITLLCVLALMLALVAGCGSQPQKMGVVDIQKVMTESPKIKQMQDQLNVKAQELTASLEKEQQTLPPAEFQKKQETAYGDFMKMKQDMEDQAEAMVKGHLDQIAKEKNLGAILFKTNVAQGGVDVTEDLMKKMQ